MDVDQIWDVIHQERRALAGILRELSPGEWEHASACDGWTVRDVAAHIIAHPQYRWREMPGVFWRGRGDFNTMIYLDGRRRGQRPIADILADFVTFDGSRRKAPFTTPHEPLIDILVHTQDILRPLGREHRMPREAAAVAASRTLTQSRIFGTRDLLRGNHLEATDITWSHGDGPTRSAPIEEILMMTTGRIPHLPNEGTS